MRRVLVIDDDISVRIAVEFSLRRHGCIVIPVDTGPIGLSEFEASTFDLVIVDIVMRDMDGLEIIKSIRERAPTVPIIAMSGYRFRDSMRPAPDFLDMAAKLGANYQLRKPFGPRQLTAAVDACLPMQEKPNGLLASTTSSPLA